jgi:hypothetical protein
MLVFCAGCLTSLVYADPCVAGSSAFYVGWGATGCTIGTTQYRHLGAERISKWPPCLRRRRRYHHANGRGNPCRPQFNYARGDVVNTNDVPFQQTFPYLAWAQSGRQRPASIQARRVALRTLAPPAQLIKVATNTEKIPGITACSDRSPDPVVHSNAAVHPTSARGLGTRLRGPASPSVPTPLRAPPDCGTCRSKHFG